MAEAAAAASIVREGTPPRWAEQLEQLRDDAIEALARTEDFGSAGGFADAVESLRVIREFVTPLAWQPRKYEKSELERDVSSHLADVLAVCQQIRAYDQTGDAKANRQNLLTRLDNERGWIAGEVGPAIRVGEVMQATTAMQEAVASAATAKEKAAEVEHLVATLREVVGNQGAKALAEYFTAQAKSHAVTAF